MQQRFTFVITWMIRFTPLLLAIEGDNNRKDTNDSFQLLSPSIERRRGVDLIIQVTTKVNPYCNVFSVGVTWIVGFTLLLLSVEGDNN